MIRRRAGSAWVTACAAVAAFAALAPLAAVAAVAALAAFSVGVAAQETIDERRAQALAEDVTTLDGILAAYYEVVSAAAGEARQVARDRTLHHPDARAIITGADDQGRPFIQNLTLAEYHERIGATAQTAFYEWEIHREVQRFGNVAHVWSTYAFSDTPGGDPQGRGINSIQLYHDGSRWWITAWIFDSERPGSAIPERFLPPGGR